MGQAVICLPLVKQSLGQPEKAVGGFQAALPLNPFFSDS